MAELSPAEQEKISSLLQNFEGAKFAIGVDRLDYTNGIDKRVEAFNQLLAAEPGSISLLQIAPSSTSIESSTRRTWRMGSTMSMPSMAQRSGGRSTTRITRSARLHSRVLPRGNM
ncbi:trehalose-6-phosphate synthase [Bradyrhizobium arachidis]|uniref:trehalose-6-phosphate synthase n=1 Tax=Bradyrhizobium arachidis TaxID=858423 RepID=UPI0021629DBB|nr:trehalose-6-phosphate synthase [Bradyrhizobium arachidis]